MHVDRTRQRNAVDDQLLVMNAIGRKTGQQNSDQCNKTGDETQPNHSLTQMEKMSNKPERQIAAVGSADNQSGMKNNRST
jgi:hypothetical protein